MFSPSTRVYLIRKNNYRREHIFQIDREVMLVQVFFEKYLLERGISVEPIGETDIPLKRRYLKKFIETAGQNIFLIKSNED